MRMELREFANAARTMHQQPGGIKRTRLMLRLRPYQSRKIFILKATDGRATITARVEHQGQLKLVESIVNDFVGECTKASMNAPGSAPSPGAVSDGKDAAAAAAKSTGQPGTALGPAPAASSASPASAASPSSAAAATTTAAAQNASHNAGGRQSKGKKGKRH